MIVVRSRRWISDEDFQELLRIGRYLGRSDQGVVFELEPSKAVSNGYTFEDVLNIIQELGLEIEGSIEELKAEFARFRALVEYDSQTGFIVVKIPRLVEGRVRDKLKSIGARKIPWQGEYSIYRLQPYLAYQAYKILEANSIEVEDKQNILGRKELPTRIQLTNISLRDYQEEALAKWLDNDRKGIIALPTGSGKTVIGIAAIARVQERTLIVTYTKEQARQWREALLKITNIPSSMIGLLYSEEKKIAPITITTYQSGFRMIKEIAPYYNMLIVDEVHHLPADKFRYIAVHSIAPYRMGLSATPFREDGRHEELFPLLGGVVYYKTPGELSEKGYLAKYTVYTVKTRLLPDEWREYLELRTMFEKFANGREFEKLVEDASRGDKSAAEALRIHSKIRMLLAKSRSKIEKAVEIARRELEKGGKIIVFTQYVEQAEEIAKRLNAWLLTGRTPDEERKKALEEFKTSKSGILVVTTVGDEGLDIPDANIGIIVSGTGSRRQFVQRLGRLLRPKPEGGEAKLYEIILEKTSEEFQARKRKSTSLDGLV
ncbi:DEAD/DEAH box helicase [Thermogladius sp. 4427co]|uniref:DEAD/DEAH box helicase n=1 Tax=Thermogladius sp. 4427co TaxID=3450718 RepID=UPI003F78AFEA